MKKEHIIQIDSAKCVGCGLCRKDCPAGNIHVENRKAAIINNHCIMCGHCAAVCPKAAISITGFDEPPAEITAPAALEPQKLLEALRTRRSIRQFTSQQVPPEIIGQIIEAGRLTPTGGNSQEVSYVVLKDCMEQFEQTAVQLFKRMLPLAKLTNPMAKRMVIDDHYFFKNAPAAILILSRNKVDGSLAASNMALMAEACGLGVLYSGFFTLAANRSRSLRRKLSLMPGETVVTTLVLGYSGVTYHRTVQKEAASVRVLPEA